ncbi:MAG: hypothetical protein A2298_04820 [Gammaproteobacteria bacterium RIFOXYB2_FULL_38_6]|nr:MAG: hypothetical protein A2298_04820 [Gammaproteobacteria bacterium RIFOXYB2_FULL_38_6]
MTEKKKEEPVAKTSESIKLVFPCDFTIKAIGKANDQFEVAFLNIIKKYFPNVKETSVTQRMSESSQYLALSVTVHAESKTQMDALYQDLTSEPEILIAL